MRIFLASDLHTELGGSLDDLQFNSPTSEDVIVLAGDIGNCLTTRGENALIAALDVAVSTKARILYTPGNHEYYGAARLGMSLAEVDAKLQGIVKEAGATFLQKDTVTVNGVTFAGCTMWTPVTDLGWRSMNDKQAASHESVLKTHADHKAWLEKQTADVFITHHLPSFEAVHTRYRAYNNTGFVAPMLPFVQPKLWLFGHTHEACDKQVGHTRLVCNPIGYPGEYRETTFSADAVVLKMPGT